MNYPTLTFYAFASHCLSGWEGRGDEGTQGILFYSLIHLLSEKHGNLVTAGTVGEVNGGEVKTSRNDSELNDLRQGC